VLKLAVVAPALVLSVPWPMLAPPSEKVTTPVGLTGPLLVTVAVNVTLWPHTVGFAAATTAVVLPALVMVCATAVETLLLKFVSPLYVAAMVCAPAGKLVVLETAVVTAPEAPTLTGLPALLPSI
jgi:hypothetical protein